MIIDTGIDLDHPFFGPDSDGNGVADRIVYQYDFLDGDNNAGDLDGHGTNVAGIVASQNATYPGVAPGADIIVLRVLSEEGKGDFSDIEKALRWVVQNASTYSIASVNLSLGDQENHTTPQTLYGIDDELAQLAANRVIVVAASGNDFYEFNSAQGVCYPAADPNAISVGAVFASGSGRQSYENDDGSPSAVAYSTGPDRIAPFSQRDASLTTVFAPGAPITSAGLNGNTATFHGSSQAAAYVSGIAVLAQELALEHLGRRLSTTEFAQLLRGTGTIIHDGDDEDDNVVNTGLDFRRVDVYALAERILTMGNLPGKHVVRLGSDQVIDGADFGNYQGVPVTALGSVDLQHLAALPSTSGGVWYAVRAARDAMLTLEGGVSSPGQSLELTLYAQSPTTGSTPAALATSTSVGGKQRIDWAVTAGQTYYFRVKSSATSIDLTIANLVARVGSQTTVFGTAGPDSFQFDAAPSLRVSIGGLAYQLPQAAAATVTFGGGEGDTAVLRGASGDETVTLRPGTATFSGRDSSSTSPTPQTLPSTARAATIRQAFTIRPETTTSSAHRPMRPCSATASTTACGTSVPCGPRPAKGSTWRNSMIRPATTSTSVRRPTMRCPARPFTMRRGTSRGAMPTPPPAASTRPNSTTRPAMTPTLPPRPTPRCSIPNIATPT